MSEPETRSTVQSEAAGDDCRESSLLEDGAHGLRGLCMGAADIIPGVSGGTVALILGIYERLVTAISRIDGTWLRLVVARQWRPAARRIDLRFLMALGLGILTGIVALGGVMNHLLTHEATRPATLALFFGMILASSLLVGRLCQCADRRQVLLCLGLGIAAAAIAWALTQLPKASVEPGLPYLFLCGLIAICAMILPGISGAFILLILGVYIYVTGLLKGLVKGEFAAEHLLEVAVFATGCLVGLISFSKVLKWLLAHRRAGTMAVLCGFMIGALAKVWPFQQVVGSLKPGETDDPKYLIYENVWPSGLSGEVLVAAAAGIAGFALVIATDWWTRRRVLKAAEAEGSSPNQDAQQCRG